MFNEERLTKKLSFSKRAHVAFSLSADVHKRSARALDCLSLFGRKSALQSFVLKFALIGFCMAFVSCANIFQDKVEMSRSGTPATLGDIFVGGSVIGKLDAPSEIHVSLYEFKDRIRISWSPVKSAAYYTLERAVVTERNKNGDWVVPDESEFEPLEHAQQLYSTSYTDTIIKDSLDDPLDYTNEKYGYAYFYRVRAENPRLGYEESDEQISSCGVLLPPPLNTNATAGESTNFIAITWNKSPGAIRYEIYRSENEDGTNSSKVGAVTGDISYYKDENVSSYNGKDLFYTISSVSAVGEKSVVGPVALGYTLLLGAPKAVDKVQVTKGKGDNPNSITIEWDPISAGAGEEITYTVYRSSSEDSAKKKLGEASNSYTDTKDLKPNVYYYYYIQTSKKEMNGEVETILKGPMSKSGPESDNPVEGFILSAPSAVEVTKIRGEENYLISFTPVIGDKNFSNKTRKNYDNNYEYIVLGSYNQNGGFSKVESASSSVLASEFKNGKYSMKVQSFDYYRMKVEYSGNESNETSSYAPAPYEARDVYVTRAQMIEDYSKYFPASTTATTELGTNSNGVHAVKITWKAPDGGASSYNIYRSEKIGSGFKKITDTPIPDGTYEYIDRNDSAKAGSIYYYYVLSLNSLGQGVNRSEIDEPTLENGIIKTKNTDGSPCGRGWGWGALSAWQYMREQRKTVESSQKKLTLMHKPNNLDKVGSETISGNISGTLSYTAKVDGLGARITMPYTNYADSYISNNKNLGIYFLFNGDTNTSSNMSANGTMDGVVTCRGMYPGKVRYDAVQIKGGNAGGGYYDVKREGIDLPYDDSKDGWVQVDYKAGNK